MYGLTRGTVTLLGAATAGFLLWLASQTDADGLGGYWTWLGLLAGAGLVMAFSQLLGGWTKWGWPRVTGTVFLLGFVPALLIGGLVLLQAQPDGAWGTGLAGDLGAEGLAEDLTGVLPALAFGLGLLFGLTFDTTGPRRPRELTTVETPAADTAGPVVRDRRSADEPVAAERHSAHRETDTTQAPTGPPIDDPDGKHDRGGLQRPGN